MTFRQYKHDSFTLKAREVAERVVDAQGLGQVLRQLSGARVRLAPPRDAGAPAALQGGRPLGGGRAVGAAGPAQAGRRIARVPGGLGGGETVGAGVNRG
jgi:hypothetical protein